LLGELTDRFLLVRAMINQSDTVNLESEPKEGTSSSIVFVLAIIFLITAIGLVFLYRRLDLDPVWVLLFVPFSLAMTGALILFHFLSSSAAINRNAYRVGGAIAGFLVLFSVLQSIQWTLVKLAKTPFGTKIMPVADRYDEILTLKN
jgi:hypothetical protein